MVVGLPEHLDRVLSSCAILRAFDAGTLYTLTGATPADLQTLLDRGRLVSLPDLPPRYTSTDDNRQDALARLRQQRPRDEIDLHAQAFHYYARQLQSRASNIEQPVDEEECLYHLGALHDLFIEYMEWDSIISYTSVLRNTALLSRHATRYLEFYEAYTEMRTADVSAGAQRLEQLLAAPDLEPGLRLRALHALHIAYHYQSRYDQALKLLHTARRLAHALGDLPRRSYVLLSIGQVYNDLYDHRRALIMSRISLRLAQKCGAFYRELHARYEVGSNAAQLGWWDQALVALDAVEEQYRGLGMTRRLATVLWAKGVICQVNGDNQRCEEIFTAALDIAQEGERYNILAAMDILMRLGLLAQTRGDDMRALEHYDQAIDQTREQDLRHWRPILQARVANIMARMGRREEAEALWRAAVDAVEALRSDIEIDAVRISLFGTTQYIYETFVLFLIEQNRPEEAFVYVERARSRAFLDLLARQPPATNGDAAQAEHPGELQTQIPSAKPATLEQVQRGLAPGEVVLEYFTSGVRPSGDHWVNKIPDHNRALRQAVLPQAATFLFIITHDQFAMQRLTSRDGARQGGHEHIGRMIDLDADKLRPSSQSDDPVLDMLRIESRIEWLSSRLLAPAESWLQSCHHVYVIPHGPLHYVPFLALRRPGGRYLLDQDGPLVAFTPSAAVLLHTLSIRHSQGHESLAIGYNGPASNRLEHAEQEAAIIAQKIAGEGWVGPEPKSHRLLSQRRLHVLHIAGHATYDSNRAYTAALHLGEGDILDAGTILRTQGGLCQAELVTLSSCMSGFSHVVAGDEVFGLQRAFLYAIAPTIICTLAKVRDRVALLVMEQFYTRLLEAAGQPASPAAAFRDALIAVRTMTRGEANAILMRYGYPGLPARGQPSEHPFAQPEYWAPFILVGRL